jgi:putative endonuclease
MTNNSLSKKMSYESKKLGNEGEDLALAFLEKKGYKLIKRNLRLFCGEIDLLMADGETLVICEVKTKSSNEFGVPQEEVDFFKKRKLVQLGKALWQLYPGHSIRIDVVAINTENKSVEHILNAVEEH